MEFQEFVRENQDMVYTTSLRITADPRDAEDIAQDVFMQAYNRFERIKEYDNPGGWLRTTTRNLSINHVMRYKKRFLLMRFDSTATDTLFSTEADGYEEWLYEQSEVLKEALLKLPDRFRIPLVLHYYENMQYDEIAGVQKISLAKIKADIMRAKQRLKIEMERIEKRNA